MQTHGSNPDANQLKHLIRLVTQSMSFFSLRGRGGGTYENPGVQWQPQRRVREQIVVDPGGSPKAQLWRLISHRALGNVQRSQKGGEKGRENHDSTMIPPYILYGKKKKNGRSLTLIC